MFRAFSRVIREAGKRFVVMDTAPTGHTLLLLDATGAYHREIAVKMGIKVILPPDDAASGPGTHQSPAGHSARNHTGTGSGKPAG